MIKGPGNEERAVDLTAHVKATRDGYISGCATDSVGQSLGESQGRSRTGN